jgi:hypothetical protein
MDRCRWPNWGATGTHVGSLYRLMRALASQNAFTEHADGRFSLTDAADPLRSDAPDSIRARDHACRRLAARTTASLAMILERAR